MEHTELEVLIIEKLKSIETSIVYDDIVLAEEQLRELVKQFLALKKMHNNIDMV